MPMSGKMPQSYSGNLIQKAAQEVNNSDAPSLYQVLLQQVKIQHYTTFI